MRASTRDPELAGRLARANLQALGRRLYARRMEQGLAQYELAFYSRTSQPHISNIEGGRSRPSLDCLRRLAFTLRLTPGGLL